MSKRTNLTLLLEFIQSVKYKQTILLYFVIFCLIVIVTGGLLNRYTKLGEQTDGIFIEEVILTSGLDASGQPINQASRFSSGSERIYCVIYFQGILRLPMTSHALVKWHSGSEQIRAHYFSTYSEPAILWIEPPDNQSFRSGKYKLEIFIGSPATLVRTKEFEIE